MIKTLWELLESLKPSAVVPTHARRGHTLELATAVLLVEVMRADGDSSEAELAAVRTILREKFQLSGEQLEKLYALAEETSVEAHDLHEFTSRLNDGFDAAEKARILELLWQVAYADGQLGAHENHLMRRLGELLHVPRAAYIGTKLRAGGADQGA
jgi:uncharacterized tellurite resistance protein B-like protein